MPQTVPLEEIGDREHGNSPASRARGLLLHFADCETHARRAPPSRRDKDRCSPKQSRARSTPPSGSQDNMKCCRTRRGTAKRSTIGERRPPDAAGRAFMAGSSRPPESTRSHPARRMGPLYTAPSGRARWATGASTCPMRPGGGRVPTCGPSRRMSSTTWCSSSGGTAAHFRRLDRQRADEAGITDGVRNLDETHAVR